MKRYLLLFVLALSFSTAHAAVGPESSWDEIRAERNTVIGFPSIFFRNIAITVDALCVDGDNIRPFQPERQVCVEWEVGDRGNERCKRYESVYLSTPRTYTSERCVKWDARRERCLVEETYTSVHPTTYNVTVYTISPRGDYREAFVKRFDMSACN